MYVFFLVAISRLCGGFLLNCVLFFYISFVMSVSISNYMGKLCDRAGVAARELLLVSTGQKNQALLAIADAIRANESSILEANQADLKASQAAGLDSALLDRLALDEARVSAMIDGLEQVARLADPVGQLDGLAFQSSGIQVGKMRVPLGVIGIVYESRPNVTVDAAALCLKSGNAVILRGGSEALGSNKAIAECICVGVKAAGLPEFAVQLVDSTDREAVGFLIKAKGLVDVVIPRGGKSLVARIDSEATVPVIKHLDGVCHVFVDEFADLDKAVAIAFNAKCQRYGTCNTMESLLVAAPVAEKLLPGLCAKFLKEGVELRGCDVTRKLVSEVKPASDEDWSTEYLAPVLSIKVVVGVDEAISHISQFGSGHSDAIVSEHLPHVWQFLRQVDSSSVLVNASTRFADGFEYGLGAEIGISTDKLHVRGPVGLEGLTSQKFVVFGDGHIR